MKAQKRLILALLFCSTLTAAHAQFGLLGRMPHAPLLGGSTVRLFGENAAFSATIETQINGASADQTIKMSGKMFLDHGSFRFEVDLSQVTSAKMPPGTAAQMKAMGMDKMIAITRSDKKTSYQIYPGLQAYVENPLPEADTTKADADYKYETTELGHETVDGHPCVKNKAVVTDPQGNKSESTIWNATDLKKFPVKIEQLHDGGVTTLLFKDVNFAKPEATLFDPPSGLAKYDNVQTLIQQQMMKRSGGFGTPREQ
jgi:hypothetical protein